MPPGCVDSGAPALAATVGGVACKFGGFVGSKYMPPPLDVAVGLLSAACAKHNPSMVLPSSISPPSISPLSHIDSASSSDFHTISEISAYAGSAAATGVSSAWRRSVERKMVIAY